jgi:alanine dehydrogenase
MREEATLHLEGLRGGAGTLAAGTAEAAQAASVLVGGGGAMIGPEPLQAASDLRADVNERTMVLAANRLIILVLAALVVGGALSLAGVVEVPGLLNGVPQE